MLRRNATHRFFLTTLALLAVSCVSGCGGGVPLLHSAHVLPHGRVTAGVGLSGQAVLQDLPGAAGTDQISRETQIQTSAMAPTMAPWVSARVGITGSNEAGLSYTGRAVRLDVRHSFGLNKKNSLALSTGLGGDVLFVAHPRAGSQDPHSLVGGGVDLPILFGWRSTAGLYSAWIGPRPGFSFVRGALADGTSFSARDVRLGFVGGLSVGFRQIHVAMELGGAFHFVDALVVDALGGGAQQMEFGQFTLTPAGALNIAF